VKRTFRMGERNPALDIVSYGRRGGAGRPLHFTHEQIAQIARTVRRAPEVMVKVSVGSNTTRVAAHFQYIGRRGELEIETDDGERLWIPSPVNSIVTGPSTSPSAFGATFRR
jgi:hypothetical protein